MTVRITGAGLQTTVQDLGRPRHQHAGIPGGGAMDRLACRAANILVGNDDTAAVLETTLIGPTLVFEHDTVLALTGGDLEPRLDERAVRMWHAVHAPAGATLRFGKAETGCRTYVAVAGGFDVPAVFGSRSTYLRAGFGGLEGRALRAGDSLATGEPSMIARHIAQSLPMGSGAATSSRWSLSATLRPAYAGDVTVRLVAGAHASLLDEASAAALLEMKFRISASSDRMGYRLEGTPLSLAAPIELLSEGVAFGTVQLPPGGAPIILMADRQTTGGYPRIGEVATVDLPLVAQLKPGDGIRFRQTTPAEAQRLLLAQERELTQARLAIGLRFAHPPKQ